MANLTDKFRKVAAEGTLTNLSAPGKAIGATSILIDSAAGWPTDTGIIVALRQVDSTGQEVSGTYSEWRATLSGTTLSFGSSPAPVNGTDQVYPAGSTTQVYIPLSSVLWNDLMDALLTSLNQDGSPAAQFVPSGTVAAFAGSSAPSGYLICDGSAVSRSTYAGLFSVVGTTYGTGNGTTTFNLPDLRAKVPGGYKSGDSNFGTLGGSGGEATHVLSTAEMPSHAHDENSEAWVNTGGTNKISFGSSVFMNTVSQGGRGAVSTAAAGGGGAHNNLQPYQTLNYIIKT